MSTPKTGHASQKGGLPTTKGSLSAYAAALSGVKNYREGSEIRKQADAILAAEREACYAAKLLAQGTTDDGKTVEFPGETPAVGDDLVVVAADGTTTPAADGEYTVMVGEQELIVSVSGGKITDAQPAAADVAAATPPTPTEPKAASAEVAALAKQVAELKKQLSENASNMKKIQGFAANYQNVQRKGGLGHYEREDLERMAMLYTQAVIGKQEGYEVRQSNKQYGIAESLTSIVAGRELNWLNKLLAQNIQIDPLLSVMTKLSPGSMEGSSAKQVVLEIPREQVSNARFRTKDRDCSFESQALVDFSKRKLTLNYGELMVEFCPRNARNQYRGVVYINDEQVPGGAVTLALLIDSAKQDLMRQILTGTYAAVDGDLTDGVLTILKGDASGELTSNQKVSFAGALSDTTGLDEVNKMVAQLVLSANRRLDGETIVALMSPKSYNHYLVDFRNTYGALPYNTSFQRKIDSPVNSDIQVVPLFDMPNDEIVLATARNLFYGIEGEANEIWKTDDRTLRISMEAYVGAQVGFLNEVIYGKFPAWS